MKPFAWMSSVAVAAQLALSVAPHPFGTPHKAVRVTVSEQTGTTPKSKVVCGTVLLEANPKFDPKMTTEPRKDVAFSVLMYPRPTCAKTD